MGSEVLNHVGLGNIFHTMIRSMKKLFKCVLPIPMQCVRLMLTKLRLDKIWTSTPKPETELEFKVTELSTILDKTARLIIRVLFGICF